jgi:hypothetical protein
MLVRLLVEASRTADAHAVAAELDRRTGVPSRIRKAAAELLAGAATQP